jgi:hypothetical protein
MPASQFDQMAAEFGRDFVARAAPQELPLYRALSQSYLSNPDNPAKTPKGKDEMLGFGMAETVTYLTPLLLPVLSSVFKFLADELKSSIHDQHLVGDLLRKVLGKSQAPNTRDAGASLTHQQLAKVRKLAFDRAKELKLDDTQASLLADSIAGRLAIGAAR